MGVYNTFQFLGVFFGGFIGGTLYGKFGVDSVFMVCGLLLIVWVILIQTAPQLRLFDSLVVELKAADITKQSAVQFRMQLQEIPGVEEAMVMQGERVAYLKVDKDQLDNQALAELTK